MKRAYVQASRAEAAQRTGEHILEAAFARFSEAYYDDVTLDQVAADAGVTVQTVIRRFGSKEGLLRALTETVGSRVGQERDEAPVGDLPAAVRNLVTHYEHDGDMVMHLLHQEARVPAYAAITTHGRQLHAEWCARVFRPWLTGLRGVARERRLAQVVATCDVYTWHLLRRQRGLSRKQVQLALTELLEGVLT